MFRAAAELKTADKGKPRALACIVRDVKNPPVLIPAGVVLCRHLIRWRDVIYFVN
jgi:hypothetical protein